MTETKARGLKEDSIIYFVDPNFKNHTKVGIERIKIFEEESKALECEEVCFWISGGKYGKRKTQPRNLHTTYVEAIVSSEQVIKQYGETLDKKDREQIKAIREKYSVREKIAANNLIKDIPGLQKLS